MDDWSSQVSDPFRVKFELDTNILPYLVDKSYPSLTQFISLIQSSEFVYETTISAFVLYEFIGIRKKEHFLRQVFEKGKSIKGDINFSSLLKYKDSYSTPHLDYQEVAEEVTLQIYEEIKFINENAGILINSQSFHEDILPPIKDLYLNSKISKEDCFVIISSVFPDKVNREKFLCLITNDSALKDGFVESKYEQKINDCFNTYFLAKPHIEHIGNKNSNWLSIDLTKKLKLNVIKPATIQFIKRLLTYKNKPIYLGETFKNQCSGISNVICVQMTEPAFDTIKEPPFLTIIGKDLDFIINTPIRVIDIRDKQGNVVLPPLTKDSFDEGKFSFAFPDFSEDYQYKSIEKDIISKIKKTGNLVFLHPDSE